jgi:hypothetical protein
MSLELTKVSVQWMSEADIQVVKQMGHRADHSSPSSEVKWWSLTSISPYIILGW